MNQWYKKDILRNLVDMHIPNGEGYLEKFDAKKYAENIKKSGASVAYIYGSNCLGLCFYPTKIGLRHKAAERDIFGQALAECKKAGLDTVGYLNSWGTFVCDEHPEWSVIDKNGVSLRDSERFGNPCPNNPEYSEYFTSLVREFTSMYDLDGLWIDMVGIWSSVCYCRGCRERFFKEYGKKLPETDSMQSADFVDYVRFKGKSVAEYAHKIRAAAHESNPDLTVSIQAASAAIDPLYKGCCDLEFFTASDYLAADFYVGRSGVNAISRMFYKLSENLPYEFMTSRCSELNFHTMNKDINDILNQAYAAFMYKGAFLLIDAIDPSGEMNSDFYDKISYIHKQLEPYYPYVDYEEEPIREAAVYFNFDSFTHTSGRVLPIDAQSSKLMLERLKSIGEALTSVHIDYDIISPKNISELKNYKLLIISSLEMMSEKEVDAIRSFVKNGGRLYISGAASLRDDKGILRDNFMLSDVIGADFCGRFDVRPNYIAPTVEDADIFGEHTRKYPHMMEPDEAVVKVRAHKDSNVLATVTLPISDVCDTKIFSSAISNPPIIETEYPGIFEHAYGNGLVIYSAGVIERSAQPDNVKLFTTLISRLICDMTVEVSAPSCVDFTVYKNKSGNLRAHFLNSQSILPPIRIDSIYAKIKIGDKNVAKVRDVLGGDVEWRVDNGVLLLKTDLSFYKMIVIDFAE